MWFHAKKIKRNTQKTKIADFTMKWVKMENRWQKFYPPADSDRRDKSHLWWLYWNWSFFLFLSAEIMVIFLESDVMFGFLDIRSPCTLKDKYEKEDWNIKKRWVRYKKRRVKYKKTLCTPGCRVSASGAPTNSLVMRIIGQKYETQAGCRQTLFIYDQHQNHLLEICKPNLFAALTFFSWAGEESLGWFRIGNFISKVPFKKTSKRSTRQCERKRKQCVLLFIGFPSFLALVSGAFTEHWKHSVLC